jgi:hypothetical protein
MTGCMKKVLPGFVFLLVFLSAGNRLYAQHIVKGQLFADSTREVLASATISLLHSKDSTVSVIVLSDSKGKFIMPKVEKGNYHLLISLLNYQQYFKPLDIGDQKEYVFDSIILKPSYDTLEGITVINSKMPVVVKTDTTEFHADAFKTMPNATVEDLLKKLPSVEVDRDGKVTAQGEKITKVLVDGKPFFGGDPQTAIQNLPANIIDKVQLIDEKSDQARRTKVDDGVHEKVLNLTIKKDKKKGYFASVNAGMGTDNKYEGALSANYFKGDKKFAVVATANNTGRNSYSTPGGEVTNNNNNGGISKDRQLRFTFNDQLSKKFNYNAGLTMNVNGNERITSRNRQNIFGDSITYYKETADNINNSKRVNGNVSLEWEPDTTTSFRLNQSGGYSWNRSSTSQNFISTIAKSEKVINKGNRNYSNESSAPTLNGQFSLNKRFKKDRSLYINMNNNINASLGEAFNISNNFFYPTNGFDYARLFNQLNNNTNRFSNVNTSINYNQKLAKKTSMSVGYTFNYGKNTTIRETFDYNSISDLYDRLNDTLSNRFVNNNYSHVINLNINQNWKKGGFGIGGRYNKAITKGRSFTNDSTYRQEFAGFSPSANLFLNGKNKRFSLNYNFNLRPPQASQLQPVIDNSNPLFIRLGNPLLKYATTHSVNYNFNLYNNKKEFNIYTNGNLSFTNNQITNSTVYDKATGQQISQPVNMNGPYNFNGYANANVPLKPGQHKHKLFFNVGVNYNQNKNVSLLNYVKNSSLNSNISSNISVRWDVKDMFSWNVNANISKQRSRYAIQSNLNNVNNNYSIGSDFDLRISKLFQFRVDYSLRTTTGQFAGFNRNVHMLNASYIQYFSPKRIMWLSVRATDILKQNISINRFVGENYIEDYQSNALTRFFMVAFNYKLNKFGTNNNKNANGNSVVRDFR